jgi:hypothetical protein
VAYSKAKAASLKRKALIGGIKTDGACVHQRKRTTFKDKWCIYSDEDEVPAGNENKDLRCILERRRKTFNSQYAVSGEFKEICFLCQRRSGDAV